MASMRAPRADAVRNRAAILEAAAELLREYPQASLADVATRAGVGRVTLYAHFDNRADLIDALFERDVGTASSTLAAVDLTGNPVDALERLILSSWKVVEGAMSLLAVAENELPADKIRAYHQGPLDRVRALIERGQAGSQFRTDLSADWLSACFYATLHGAAAELRAGRLREDEADRVVLTTLTSLFTAGRVV